MKFFKLSVFILSVLACGLWYYTGSNIDQKEFDTAKKREIKEIVTDINKPADVKCIELVFRDGSKFAPYTNGLNDRVEIGDSIYKRPNAWRYVIYKNANPSDSIVYEWSDESSNRITQGKD